MRYISTTDLKIVARNSGILMIGIGVMCLIPLIVNLIFFEFDIVLNFVVPAAISMGLGYLFMKFFDAYTSKKIRLKHGMMISSFAWFWAGIVGGIIISLSANVPLIDGIFESVSALTGTGITIFENVEILPYSILFFRALEQWVGGLGVIVVLLIFITPGSLSSKLYKSEAREEKIKPSIKATIKATLKIYAIYTALGILLYILAGMPIFDSICNTFCTISTGGMCVKNANIGYYQNELIYLVSIIIMILGATSFLVHYKIIKTKGKSLLKDLQFKVLISVIALVSLMLYFVSDIVPIELVFTVTSTVTTTGASVNSVSAMAGWPPFVILCLMALMLIGGSSGSTVGAIKLVRVITFCKGIYASIREILSPEGRVVTSKINNVRLSEKEIGEAGKFIVLYMIFIFVTWGLFCLFGYDPFKSLFATMSLQGNNGLELGIINHSLHPVLKVVSMIGMWAGRLEIYPILVLVRAGFEIFR